MTTTPARDETTASADPVVDCGVVIVAYRSAADVRCLLKTLPAAADGLRLHVVVVDNHSRDDIAEVVGARPDVDLVEAGANLGYAGAINLGRTLLPAARAVLVLNPDLRLGPGCVRRLFDALQHPGTGASVPRLVDDTGLRLPSLRREPSIRRALGDALFGDHWPGRPGWLSEMVRTPSAYQLAATVDWATGAAVLVAADVDAAIGPWDDTRFFLYCEETDFMRRLREAGWGVRYVPEAVAAHRGGGSGGGAELVALGEINRVRYFRKYHGRVASGVFRCVVGLHQLLRLSRPGNRLALRVLCGPIDAWRVA